MRAHVDAIVALLTPLGYPVSLVDATGVDGYPRVTVWFPAGDMSGVTLDDARSDLDARFGVTTAALTAEGVLTASARVRSTLTPLGLGTLTVSGRAVWLRWEGAEAVTVDRDVTDPATNSHPFYGVDLFRLVSTPV